MTLFLTCPHPASPKYINKSVDVNEIICIWGRCRSSGGGGRGICNPLVVIPCRTPVYTQRMMTDTPILDKLFLLRLAFKGLDDDELAQVAALTEFRTYPANHILCHEGAYEGVLYIIAEGRIVIS